MDLLFFIKKSIQLLIIIVILVIVSLLREYFESKQRKNINGVYYSIFIKSLGLVFSIFCIIFVWLVLIGDTATDGAKILIAISFPLGAIAVYLETNFKKIIFNDPELISHSPWTGTRKLNIRKLKSINYSKMFQWHVLIDHVGTVIRLSDWLTNKDNIIKKVTTQV